MRRFSMALVRFKGTSIQLTGHLIEMGNVTKELCPINSQKNPENYRLVKGISAIQVRWKSYISLLGNEPDLGE